MREATLLSERQLHLVWRLGLFRRRGLLVEDGRRLEVIHPGWPAGAGGPDFTASRLVLAGREVCGDVELHRSPSGWRAHRHASDPAYAGVALHVALRRDGGGVPAVPYGSTAVPELILEPYLEVSVAELAAWTPEPATGAGPSGPGIVEALEALGRERFERRRRELSRIALLAGREEAVYRGILGALGYRANRAPFAELARLVPWSEVRGSREEELRGRYRAAGRGLPWRNRCGRPANRPDLRLEGWCRTAPRIEDPSELGAARIVEWSEGRIGPERAAAIEEDVLLPARGDLAAWASRPAGPVPGPARRVAAALGLGAGALATAPRLAGLLEWMRRHPAASGDLFEDRLARGPGEC